MVGRSDLEIHTPTAVAAARGTKFIIWAEGRKRKARSCTMVFEGEVLFRNKRDDIKKMLKGFYRTNKKIKGNIFHAIQNVKPEYLP